MIQEHRIFRTKTYDGSDLELEVNWSDHAKVKDCQIIRLRSGDKEIEVERNELVNILMMVGNKENQKKLMPMKLTKIRKLERLLTFEFKAKRTYKEGDIVKVTAPWIDVVPEIEEVFAGNLGKKNKLFIGK